MARGWAMAMAMAMALVLLWEMTPVLEEVLFQGWLEVAKFDLEWSGLVPSDSRMAARSESRPEVVSGC
jgi:hypothetical protein